MDRLGGREGEEEQRIANVTAARENETKKQEKKNNNEC